MDTSHNGQRAGTDSALLEDQHEGHANTSHSTTSRDQISEQTFHPFPWLAPELRLRVWHLAFSPPTIQLHIHRRDIPATFSDDDSPPPAPGQLSSYWPPGDPRAISVHFTATIIENSAFSFHSMAKSKVVTHPPTSLAPPGPIALQVCRDSREITLERYELAFGGKLFNEIPQDDEERLIHEEWRRGTFWEKKILVNFKHDLLLIDHLIQP